MTTQDMIDQIRSALVEPVAGFWSDDEILLWINRSVSDFANRTRILEDKDYTSTQAGVPEYALPANCLSVKAVFINTATIGQSASWRRVRPTNLEKMAQETPNFLSNDSNTNSSPLTYSIWGRTLILNPTPAEDGSDNIAMFYKAKPISILNASQQVDLDDSLHEAVIAYVLWRAYEKEKEYEQATWQREIYEGYIKHGLRWQKKQSGDQRYRLDIDSPISMDGYSNNEFNPLA